MTTQQDQHAALLVGGAGLAQRSEFVAALLDSLADGIAACDAEGRLVLFNRATERIHGQTIEAVDPERYAEHYGLYDADGATLLATDQIPLLRALRGETVENVPQVIAPPGGAVRRVSCTGRQLVDDDGNVLGAVVAMHDETDRIEALEQLAARAADLAVARSDRQRLARLEVLQEVSLELLDNQRDSDTMTVAANAALRLFAAEGAEVSWWMPGFPRRTVLVGERDGEALDVPVDGGDAGHGRIEVWRDDGWSGEERALLAQFSVVAGHTARSRSLHRRLARSETLRLRDQLLAAVSHDVQTPIATILGLSEALAAGSIEGHEVQRVGVALQRQARTLRHLAQGFLDHGRIGANQDLLLRPVDVHLPDVVSAAASLFDAHGRTEVGAPPAGLPPVHADPGRIEQVLVQLLDNAHRHAQGPVSVVLLRRSDSVVVQVRDHGPGLGDDPAELLRADDAGGGDRAGVGLPLCRRLVELMGGTLDAHEHPTGGAVLEVVLPQARR